MQQAAGDLIAEDAALSRGLADDEAFIQEERQIDEDIEQRRRSESIGSARRYSDTRDSLDVPDDIEEAEGRHSSDQNAGFKFGDRSESLYDLAHSRNDTQRNKRAKRKAFLRRAIINVLFIASWWAISLHVVVLIERREADGKDKWMFSPEHNNFEYPLFVTTFHMIVQFMMSGLVLALFPRFRPKASLSPTDYAIKAAPCGTATGLDIGLSNLSLKTITLSFYTMCKSSTLGFVLLFAFIFRLEQPTWKLTGIIALITIGLVLMVSGETNFNLLGMVEVLTASAMGGLRWALTQKLLDKEALGLNNPFATLFFLAPVMAATLAICSFAIEGPRAIFSSDQFWGSVSRTLQTGALIIFPGFLAFFMTISEFALIQRTSVVTLSVAGIFKEVSTIFLSTTIFHDRLTPINISGLCITLVGIAIYNYLRFYEAVSTNASPQTTFAAVTERNGESAMLRPRQSMQDLPLYDMADSNFVNRDKETQHTIIGDDDDLSDDDSNSIRKEHAQIGKDQPDLSPLKNDPDLAQQDREFELLEQELDRR